MSFEKWWSQVGSGVRVGEGNEHEEHAYEVAEMAWHKGNEDLKKFLSDFVHHLDLPENVVTPDYIQVKMYEYLSVKGVS